MADTYDATGEVISVVGGEYNAGLPTLTDGQEAALQLNSRGALMVSGFAPLAGFDGVTPVPIGDSGNNNNRPLLSGYLYRGDATWDRPRTPVVFKVINNAIGAGADSTIWTPAAGKKFRVMGFSFTSSVATDVLLKDNTGGTVIYRQNFPAAVPFALPSLGNGILSTAANNVLAASMVAAGTLTGLVWGTEE